MNKPKPEGRHFRALIRQGCWAIQTKEGAVWKGSLVVLGEREMVDALARLEDQGCVIENSPDIKDWRRVRNAYAPKGGKR